MKKIDEQIEKCKAELEELYARARAGEACMGDVIALSKKLDILFLMKAGRAAK